MGDEEKEGKGRRSPGRTSSSFELERTFPLVLGVVFVWRGWDVLGALSLLAPRLPPFLAFQTERQRKGMGLLKREEPHPGGAAVLLVVLMPRPFLLAPPRGLLQVDDVLLVQLVQSHERVAIGRRQIEQPLRPLPLLIAEWRLEQILDVSVARSFPPRGQGRRTRGSRRRVRLWFHAPFFA